MSLNYIPAGGYEIRSYKAEVNVLNLTLSEFNVTKNEASRQSFLHVQNVANLLTSEIQVRKWYLNKLDV